MLRRSVVLFMLGAGALGAAGCKSSHPAVKDLSVADSVAAHKSGAIFVDANGEDFRKENGKVPGAILLESYRKYEPKSVLPASQDTQLVFYCSNKR